MAHPAQSGYELPFVAEYYDCLPLFQGRKDIDFYLRFAAAAGDPILELGCGTGRVLLPLAGAGHRVCGLDLSEQMLAQFRRKLGTAAPDTGQRIRLVQGDMAGFDLGERFRLITVPFRPFQHLLTVESQLACLRAAHSHLEPGGRIILDLFHTDPRRLHDQEFLKEREAHGEVTLADGRRIRLAERTVTFHRAEQVNDVELIYYVMHPDGRSERLVHAFPIRYFFRYEVEHLLALSNFRVANLFGGFDQSPLRDDSAEMLFVAEKTSA
jgi:SAM-dependent methyltransferase